jgi:hypothetical protein
MTLPEPLWVGWLEKVGKALVVATSVVEVVLPDEVTATKKVNTFMDPEVRELTRIDRSGVKNL